MEKDQTSQRDSKGPFQLSPTTTTSSLKNRLTNSLTNSLSAVLCCGAETQHAEGTTALWCKRQMHRIVALGKRCMAVALVGQR